MSNDGNAQNVAQPKLRSATLKQMSIKNIIQTKMEQVLAKMI